MTAPEAENFWADLVDPEPGRWFRFDCVGGPRPYMSRLHRPVQIVRALSPEEVADPGVGDVFLVRAADGWVGRAFREELAPRGSTPDPHPPGALRVLGAGRPGAPERGCVVIGRQAWGWDVLVDLGSGPGTRVVSAGRDELAVPPAMLAWRASEGELKLIMGPAP